jgi:uncharacterized protein YjiS (DUF1127 family)
MTDTACDACDARIARIFPPRAAASLCRLLRAYWDHQVRRAAVILDALDDRTLADIGIHRTEIGALASHGSGERLRRVRRQRRFRS